MTRQAFNRILLSLLLLITQQMAATHAMSHWGASLHAAGQGQSAGQRSHALDSDLSRAYTLDQSCDQCLAFAQLAGPLGHTHRSFAPPDLAGKASLAALCQPLAARTVCAFRSRAPPSA